MKADKEWLQQQFKNEELEQIAVEGAKATKDSELQPLAARILMKVFYGARLARYDLLRAIGYLATRITKWDRWCDQRIHRLMCYVDSTLALRMRSLVNQADAVAGFVPSDYADADFAGDQKDSKSTNGGYLCVVSPRSHCQISATSKKQTAVSHPTLEAEIVSADHSLKTEGLPALDLFDILLERKAVMEFYEDNETCALYQNREVKCYETLRTHTQS